MLKVQVLVSLTLGCMSMTHVAFGKEIQENSKEQTTASEAPAAAHALPAFTGKIIGNKVRMRLHPNLESPIVQELAAGDMVVVDGEIDGPVVGLVGELVVHQPLDDGDHFRNVVGRLRIKLGVLDAQEVAIGVKNLGDRRGDFGDALFLFGGGLDDLVVDVGEIHHLVHFPSAQSKNASQQIAEQKRAEVAEMRGTVDGGTAGVDANRLPIGGRKRFDFAGEGVVEAEVGGGHWRKVDSAGWRVNDSWRSNGFLPNAARGFVRLPADGDRLKVN